MRHLTLSAPLAWTEASPSRGVALVVEDDEVLRELVVEILASDGWEAEGVENLSTARVALGRARTNLLVVDFQLGAETSRGLLAELAHAPDAPATLLMSAAPEACAVAAGLGVTFVRKPFDIDELLSLAKAVAAQARARPAPRSGLRARTR